MARIQFKPDVLEALTEQLGMFNPSGLNDDVRADMRDKPFIAVDPEHAHEVDDAIRVKRHAGGSFTVEVAIADGSQLSNNQKLIDEAIQKRASQYDLPAEPHTIPMLPRHVGLGLGLAGNTARALVVSRYFTRDLDPTNHITITPAEISVLNTTYEEFGLHCQKNRYAHTEDPIVGFQHHFKYVHGLNYLGPNTIWNAESSKRFSKKLVESYMVMANIAVAKWATDQQLPILFRNFDGTNPWDQEDDVGLGVYSAQAGVHHGIRRITAQDAAYMHATSPLRRAPDLVNHLQIGSHISGAELPYTHTSLETLSQHFNYRTAESDAA
jgi:ribonuclease R